MDGITNLKSSTEAAVPPERDDDGSLIPVATRLKLRGIGGRLTAHLVADGIDQFRGRSTVLVGRSGGPRDAARNAQWEPIKTHAVQGVEAGGGGPCSDPAV